MTGQNNGQKEITDEEWTYMKSWLRPVMLSIVKSKRILLEGAVSYTHLFGLNGSRVKEWVPGLRYNKYPSSSSWEEGMSTYLPVWGFKVWKGTSNGDGILRTQDDINRYWSYLESVSYTHLME